MNWLLRHFSTSPMLVLLGFVILMGLSLASCGQIQPDTQPNTVVYCQTPLEGAKLSVGGLTLPMLEGAGSLFEGGETSPPAIR